MKNGRPDPALRGVYTEMPRMGTMRVVKDVVLWRLSWGALETMQVEEPALAIELHRFIATVEANLLKTTFHSVSLFS